MPKQNSRSRVPRVSRAASPMRPFLVEVRTVTTREFYVSGDSALNATEFVRRHLDQDILVAAKVESKTTITRVRRYHP